MPSRVWSHLCDYATVDAGGKATIIGEFDRIFAPNVPIQHPLFFVISKWAGNDNESFSYQIRVISPSRKEVLKGPRSIIIVKGNGNSYGNHINIDSFMMINIEEFGEYAIEIIVNENPVHILPLVVAKVPN